jgi:hypothetical protein
VSRVFNCVLLAYAQVLDGSIGAELVNLQVVALANLFESLVLAQVRGIGMQA